MTKKIISNFSSHHATSLEHMSTVLQRLHSLKIVSLMKRKVPVPLVTLYTRSWYFLSRWASQPQQMKTCQFCSSLLLAILAVSFHWYSSSISNCSFSLIKSFLLTNSSSVNDRNQSKSILFFPYQVMYCRNQWSTGKAQTSYAPWLTVGRFQSQHIDQPVENIHNQQLVAINMCFQVQKLQ